MIQVTLSGDTRNTVSDDTSDTQWRYKEQSVVGDTRSTVSSDTSTVQSAVVAKREAVVGDTRNSVAIQEAVVGDTRNTAVIQATLSSDTRSKASDMSLRPRHGLPACHTCVVQWFAPPWNVVDVPVTPRVFGHTPSRRRRHSHMGAASSRTGPCKRRSFSHPGCLRVRLVDCRLSPPFATD